MWTCPACSQKFLHTNQSHSCNDRTLDDFLQGKSAHTIELFDHFIEVYRSFGDFELHPTKSKIGLAAAIRFCSITQLGRNFVHGVFHLDRLYEDNFCFVKMGQIPGSNTFNHHFRLFEKDDVNDELKEFMKIALKLGTRKLLKD